MSADPQNFVRDMRERLAVQRRSDARMVSETVQRLARQGRTTRILADALRLRVAKWPEQPVTRGEVIEWARMLDGITCEMETEVPL